MASAPSADLLLVGALHDLARLDGNCNPVRYPGIISQQLQQFLQGFFVVGLAHSFTSSLWLYYTICPHI